MIISDTYHKRKGKGNESNELFASFVIAKYINSDIEIGYRGQEKLPDCFTCDFKEGYEIAQIGFISDFINSSVLYHYTNRRTKFSGNKNNFKDVIVSKLSKLNNGHYSKIKGKIHLVLFYGQRADDPVKIKYIVDLFSFYNKQYSISYDSLILITTTRILNYDMLTCDSKTVKFFKENEYNILIKEFINFSKENEL